MIDEKALIQVLKELEPEKSPHKKAEHIHRIFNVKCVCGRDRLVIIPKDDEIVYKVGYTEQGKHACYREVFRYHHSDGAKRFLAESSCLYDEEFYLEKQKRATTYYHFWEQHPFDLTWDERFMLSIDKVEELEYMQDPVFALLKNNATDWFTRLAYEQESDIKNLRDFLKKWEIEDLYTPNIGFLSAEEGYLPIIFDYAD